MDLFVALLIEWSGWVCSERLSVHEMVVVSYQSDMMTSSGEIIEVIITILIARC